MEEHTIFDFDPAQAESYFGSGTTIVGLDGISERVRKMIEKPITDRMWRDFWAGVASLKKIISELRVFCVIGFPTENKSDLEEFKAAIYGIGKAEVMDRYKARVGIHPTPFKPMPATPLATWPVSRKDYRQSLIGEIKHPSFPSPTNYIYASSGVVVWLSRSIETPNTIALTVACLRGTEADAPALRKIACSSKFWNANSETRMATLENYLDIPRLFGTYTWEELPTRYLRTFCSNEQLAQVSDKHLRKYGGAEGARIADAIRGQVSTSNP